MRKNKIIRNIVSLTILVVGLFVSNYSFAQYTQSIPTCYTSIANLIAVGGAGSITPDRVDNNNLLNCRDQINASHYDVRFNLRQLNPSNHEEMLDLEEGLRGARETLDSILSTRGITNISDGPLAVAEVARQYKILDRDGAINELLANWENNDGTLKPGVNPNDPRYLALKERIDQLEDEADSTNSNAVQQSINQTRPVDSYSPYKCSLFEPGTWGGCFMNVLAHVFAFVLWVISWILWLATKILNFSIDLSINQFRDYTFSNGVQAAWKICRDIANIFFIFILLYIAINTVINRAGWERMVGMVIGMALLVNFSAVIPRTIIDISNMFAVQIYNNMVDLEDSNGNPDISGAILAKSQKLIGYQTGITTNPNDQAPKDPASMSIRAIGAAVLMMAVVFVLIVAAVLFIYRTLALIIAIIVSPLAVMAWALPKQSHFADKWLNTIIKESFYAPIFLFFLYIALKIYSETTFTSTSSVAEQVIMFILFYGMVMFAITAAREAGARGSDQAVKMGNKFKGLFTGAAAGIAGTAGVYGIGRQAQKILEKPWVKELKKSGAGRLFNDLVLDKTLGRAAASKYGSSQSYKERVDKNADRVSQFKTAEDQAQYIASLGTTDRAAAWGKLSERQKAEVYTHIEKIEKDAITAGRPLTDSEQKMVMRVRGDGTDTNKGLLPPMGTEARDKFDDEVRRVQETHSTRDARNIIDAVRPGLTDAQIAAEMSRTTKRTINPANIDAEINTSIAQLTGKTVTRISPDIISNPRIARHLSVSQLQSLHRDGSLTDTQKIAIRTEILRVAAPGTATHTWLTTNQAGMTFGV